MLMRPSSHVFPAALQQHPLYATVATRLGACTQSFCAEGGMHAQILSRRFAGIPVHWLPRGPVWAAQTDPTAKQRFLRSLPRRSSRRGLWLGLPETSDDTHVFKAAGYIPVLTPQSIAELDLTLPPAARLAAQHGKWRNRMRRALYSRLSFDNRPIDPRCDQALLGLEEQQRAALGYRALPPAFTLQWSYAAPNGTRFFQAREGEDTAAFMAFLLHFPVATYHAGWSGPQGRRNSAHHALLWQAANWLSDHGFTRLDLGSVDTENAPGLARFKIGSGARVRRLGPTMLRLPGIASR